MAVDVLADMFTSSLLDPDEFENERGVILEELSMAGDDPADVANERFFEAVLGEHPLGRPIGGDPEAIRSATRAAVADITVRTTGRKTSSSASPARSTTTRSSPRSSARSARPAGTSRSPQPRRAPTDPRGEPSAGHRSLSSNGRSSR